MVGLVLVVLVSMAYFFVQLHNYPTQPTQTPSFAFGFERWGQANVQTFSRSFESPIAQCSNYLAYDLRTLVQKDYLSWFGIVGTSSQNPKFDAGHFIERHIAVNEKCTSYQTKNRKTVFYNYSEMLKAHSQNKVLCNFDNSSKFTYDEHRSSAAPSSYFKGIDCATNEIQMFSKFFIQYKRTLQETRPNLQEYLNSTMTTIWTFYPERS